MAKKNKRQKKGLGKRLWHSITEPIPDDQDDQNNEQIPLAYDLKDPESSAPTPESEAPVVESTAPASEASVSATASRRQRQTTPESAIPAASAAPQSEAASATSAAASSASWANMPKSTDTGLSAASNNGQPVISIHATEAESADEEPEIPLSREALFEDQQPNAGSAAAEESADSEPMSRLARHHDFDDADEFASTETATDASENPHLKKKQKPVKPHQKPKKRRSGKLAVAGVGLLIVAALGFMFMWTHAKTTQAQAKANAESLVSEIYTTDAQRDLRRSASDDKLEQLQTYIDEMAKSSEKTSLQSQHDLAAKMLDVRDNYDGLFTSDKLIKSAVTTKTVANVQTVIKQSGLTSKKAYFTKKYTTKLTSLNKTVKKVQSYHQDYKDLYTKKGKLKSNVSTTDVDQVLKDLKKYRNVSALAATDYTQLKADRKALAKSESSAAAASASSYSAYLDSSAADSESAASSASKAEASSSDESTYSSSDDSTSSTGTTDSTNAGTSTSSAKHSSSTTTSNSQSTDDSASSSTTTGTTNNDTTGTNDTTTTN